MAAKYFNSYSNSEELEKLCRERILESFSEVSKTLGFFEIDGDGIKSLLEDDLLEGKEEEFFFMAMQWIEHDLEGRMQYLDDVLNRIRFPLIPSSLLPKLEQNKTASKSPLFKDMLSDAMKFYASPSSYQNNDEKKYQQRIGKCH